MMNIDFTYLLASLEDSTTLDMATESLDGLEIRPGSDNLHYFYDSSSRRLIKDFKLSSQPRVALYCGIRLVAHADKYSPRIRLWKRDLTKRAVQDWEAGTIRGSHLIKGSVDTDGGHENFVKLMAYVVNLSAIEVAKTAFKMIEASDAEIIETLRGRSRDEVLPIIQSAIDGPLTGAEIATLSGRKAQLDEFDNLLHSSQFIEDIAERNGRNIEAIWQDFFERASWIFGYGLNLISHAGMDDGKLERITVGNNIWTGGGSRSDAVMRSRAQISTLLFCEIKRHDTPLLQNRAYRGPDVYVPSNDLVGGIAQVQKTVRKAIRLMINQVEGHTSADGTPTGLEFSTTKPRQVLVIGNLHEFRVGGGLNAEKVESFELFRKSNVDVEVITFDELYERARFIIES